MDRFYSSQKCHLIRLNQYNKGKVTATKVILYWLDQVAIIVKGHLG